VRWYIWRMRYIQKTVGSRKAAGYFANKIGVYPLETLNESYYQDVVNYDQGTLLAHMGRQEEADALISSIGMLPGTGGNLLFGFHQYEAMELHLKQRAAAERGMVSLFITSLPKSGSASLTQSLGDFMDAPILRLSLGRVPHYTLVQSWADRVKQGGMVTHDHFTATPHNLAVMKKAGIERIVVQIRDPRASTLSMLQMKSNQFNDPKIMKELKIAYREVFLPHVEWISRWLEAEKTCPWLTIQWVKYRDFAEQPREVLASLLAPYDHVSQMREIKEKIERGEGEMVQANFHAGNDDRWRKIIPLRLQKRMWQAFPKDIIEKLDLKE